jgi:hypothetical protein
VFTIFLCLYLVVKNIQKESKENKMKKIVSGIVLIASTVLFAQDSLKLHSLFQGNKSDVTKFTKINSLGNLQGSRGVWSGSDLDKDGRMEVWATDYTTGGQVHAFEWYYGDTLVHVWSSDSAGTAYSSGTRWIQTGDLDGDGLGEVIFFAGRYNNSDSLAGLYVYEWDGVTDNGYSTKWHRNLNSALTDSIGEARVEYFSVNDIDGDGTQEIIWANNGEYGAFDKSSGMSGDKFVIASVQGDIGVLPTLKQEFVVSPRANGSKLGGGSPVGVAIADTDGDGKMEAVCFSWNNLSCFIIEATGPDAYVVSDTGFKMVTIGDDWSLAPAVADVDKDGKDEVFVGAFGKKILYVLSDTDGDATTFLKTEYAAIDTLSALVYGVAANNNTFGNPAVFVAQGTGISKYDFSGSNVLDKNSWTKTEVKTESSQTGAATKLFAGANLDRDSFGEVIISYQGVKDSLYVGTDSVKVNPYRTFLRVLEWSGKSSDLGVRDIVLITPEDYKLSQNYPNPFNPTTTIEYTLPIASQLSISIFNVMGQEVATVLPLQDKQAGTYRVSWNGMDNNGNQVASGTYFYSMRFGNFTKTKQMTFMK